MEMEMEMETEIVQATNNPPRKFSVFCTFRPPIALTITAMTVQCSPNSTEANTAYLSRAAHSARAKTSHIDPKVVFWQLATLKRI
jgi:hypothetical protein